MPSGSTATAATLSTIAPIDSLGDLTIPFVLAVIAAGLGAAAIAARVLRLPAATGRLASIDGLRGLLAWFVFVHHGAHWYVFAHTGNWRHDGSRVVAYLGRGSVAMFFMITAFLFTSRLLETRVRGFDWLRFLVSRVLRLTPLYLAAMLVLFLCVAAASDFTRVEPWPVLAANALRWLTFTVAGTPDLNGVHGTELWIAGVVWSLPYEWFFYLLLPLLALAIGCRVPWGWFALAVAAAAGLWLFAPFWPFTLAFVPGMAAAWLVRSERFRTWSRSPLAALVVLAAVALAVARFAFPFDAKALALLGVAFALIAGGNDLFGMLSWRCSRLLGDVSYSVYLLHGLFLAAVFHFGLGLESARGLSPGQHLALVVALVPVLLLLVCATFRWIESPPLRRVDAVTAAIRAAFRRRA
ncbi:MAG: acyltransferase [Planctomycetota bacterium]